MLQNNRKQNPSRRMLRAVPIFKVCGIMEETDKCKACYPFNMLLFTRSSLPSAGLLFVLKIYDPYVLILIEPEGAPDLQPAKPKGLSDGHWRLTQ